MLCDPTSAGASFLYRTDIENLVPYEAFEVRAFGLFLSDMVQRCYGQPRYSLYSHDICPHALLPPLPQQFVTLHPKGQRSSCRRRFAAWGPARLKHRHALLYGIASSCVDSPVPERPSFECIHSKLLEISLEAANV